MSRPSSWGGDDEDPFGPDAGEPIGNIDTSRFYGPPTDDDDDPAQAGETREVIEVEMDDAGERRSRLERGKQILAQFVSPDEAQASLEGLLSEKGGKLLTTFTQQLTNRLAAARRRVANDLPPEGNENPEDR